MCGIAGFQGRFDRGLLDRMNAAQAHRGPDGEGAAVLAGAGGVPTGLAHRRLAIIDLSADGAQPMTVRCPRCRSEGLSDLALSYNGELYNFAELRRELEARGHRFHSHTDSEVLLHLFADEGPAMLPRLNGIFAFAIHDGREAPAPGCERGDLFLARDQLGVKPLYLSEPAEGLLFASELKALLAHPGLARTLDLVALHHTLAYLWCPAPRTALAAVRKLPPGHALLASGGRVRREWAWWDLPFDGHTDPLPAAEAREALFARVERAVRRQLVADVPVGAFLSGGLDSSAVVAMMRRAAPDRAPACYCIGWEEPGDFEGQPSDLPYARRVAAHLGVPLHELLITPASIGRLGDVVWHLDEPQADPAPINALLIAEAARAAGVPVLLSGAGGDDILTGYRRHLAVAHERRWAWAPTGMRRGVAGAARAALAGASHLDLRSSLVRRAAKAAAYVDYDADRRLATYWWWSPDEVRRPLLAPGFAEAVAGHDTAAPLLASLARIPAEHDPLQRMLYLEAKHFLADHNLNYTDKTGMAAGVEVRVPLLDVELVEFATRLPPALKQQGRVGKALFKQAMAPLLPHDVVYRGKTGFGAPLRRWLDRELRAQADDLLDAGTLRRRGLFDPDAVARFRALDRAGRVDGAYTIFALMSIELWCRQFVGAP